MVAAQTKYTLLLQPNTAATLSSENTMSAAGQEPAKHASETTPHEQQL
jgi:hypothetical protein